MKNIQIIDGALNCTYSIFAVDDEDFLLLFPGETDIGFPDEIADRIGAGEAARVLDELWRRPVRKAEAHGIHGTLFYGLDQKKRYYPTRKDAEMVVGLD